MNDHPDPSLEREREIFLAALERAPGAERQAFLDGACGHDDALRAQVEALLRHHAEDDFLEAPALNAEARVAGESNDGIVGEGVGAIIGRYKLLEKIGEGGMGVVYMAEQEEPVRRKVALKVIKLGMDTKQVVARFEAERQALALMDHPHIAKVLDGGATDTGRPFFVMELVQGVPITDFCDQNQLSVQERLKLFIPVSQAIQSAHQKGIIHRDLKPTNILVTLNAGMPHPMVIDFGVAKAMNQKLTEKTIFTNFATMIGTPAYMSPEQAEMSHLDVDTRSDIYGLGVLLYELLTGSTPFSEQRLRSAGYQEMQRIIMEEEPERPSTRLRRKSIEVSTPVAAARRQPVSSDLDWIVMKCLEKDRARRYETANGLAMDLQRHLDNEPVVARPPSNLYRVQKLVRRNTLAVAAGALVTVALVLGAVVATWQAVRAANERDAKELALREQTRLREQAQALQREQTGLREQAQAEAYASDMMLAQQALTVDNPSFARELLNRHRPATNSEKDFRGWEWRYLWQQCTSDSLAKVWQASYKISNLTASPDGKWLAVGQNSDATAVSILKFEDRARAVLVTNIAPHRGTDVNVAFSPTGALLAFNSTRYDGTRVQPTLHLWDVETSQPLWEHPVRSFCGGLAFSPDGSALLDVLMNDYGATNGTVLLLKMPEGTLIWKCETPISNPCPRIAVDSAFRSAAIEGDGLQVMDLSEGKLRWSVTNEYFLCAAFTRDGRMLMTVEGSPSILHVWDAKSGKPIGRPVPLNRGQVDEIAVLPDGRTMVSCSDGGGIQYWDISDPTQPHKLGRPLRSQGGEINTLALAGDGKTLLTGSFAGTVYAWDIAPRKPEPSLLALKGVFDWQFAPDSRSLLVIDPQGRVTRREGPDFQQKTPVLDIGTNLAVIRHQADFSEDCELLATSQEGTVRIWDLRTRASSPRLVIRGWLGTHSFAQDSKLLALYDTVSGPLDEWDLNTFQKVGSWPTTIPWKYRPIVALSSQGRYLLNMREHGNEGLMIDVATGKAGHWKNPEAGGTSDGIFSPDGSLFAVGNVGGYAQIRESGSQRLVATVGHRQYSVKAVGFSPDRSRVVTASEGRDTLTLWDLGGRELLRLQTGSDLFLSLRFSPDSTWLASVNYHNELYLWRAPSWTEIEATEKTAPSPPDN